ncbi:hypothetical protein [Glycomyces albidus]|uniref:hypothetical protein n=1 Tax=Glycomyces albidus TaxID=2656774 RepID=UPI00188438C7|nr:hypothetical protein [Glycomyces albidus]
MTYPQQPGYPSPYGQQPPGRQQNNLWLIGGSIIAILVVIMTVILVVVQSTQADDSADGGTDGGGDTSTEGEGDGGDDGGDDSDGGSDGGGSGSIELNAEACSAFDLSTFESAYGSYDPDETYTSATSSGGLPSVSCTFYNNDYTSVSIYITDWESADETIDWVKSDAEYYNSDGYTYTEWTEYGDAGGYYSQDYGTYTSTTLHVALGSLDVSITSLLYDDEDVEFEAAFEAWVDLVKQSDALFADYK